MHTIYITAPNDRPDFRLVITFLWSDGQSVDTDGNSHHPASRVWTELYVQNREHEQEVVTISEHQETPLILRVDSPQEYLAARTAYFLATFCGGKIEDALDGEQRLADSLLSKVGFDFDVTSASQRVAQSPYIHSSHENPYPNLDKARMLKAKAMLGI